MCSGSPSQCSWTRKRNAEHVRERKDKIIIICNHDCLPRKSKRINFKTICTNKGVLHGIREKTYTKPIALLYASKNVTNVKLKKDPSYNMNEKM